MNREEYVRTMLAEDAELDNIGVEEWYRSNAPDDPTHDVFATLIWGAHDPRLPEGVGPRELVVWVYALPGYYGTIDQVLERVRELMLAVQGDDVRQVEWRGDSGDLYDDKYDRALRTGAYTVH